MQGMRLKFWSGIGLTSLAFLFFLFTLLFPQAQTASTSIHLTDGTQVTLSARIPVRGWVGDGNGYSLKVDTQAGTSSAALLRLGARLEMGNVMLNPSGTIERSLKPGDSIRFDWQATAYQRSETQGVLWLYQIDDSGNSYALYARQFTFSAREFVGINLLWARIAAGAILITGALLIGSDLRKKKRKTLSKNVKNQV
jgi:hypothetical protein